MRKGFTWYGVAVCFDLPGPIIYGFEGGGIIDIEHYHHCIAVLIVKSKKGSELLLPSCVPNVHLDRFAPCVVGLVAMEART